MGKAGGTAEVGWALSAQHGGGYTYRLCPKGQALTEACFQANGLRFSGKNSTVRYHDGSKADFQIPVADLHTAGQHWRRNPIPGCSCDLGWGCGGKQEEVLKVHSPSPSPSPSPGGKDYVCYLGQCYKKPGFGKMTKETCSTTCGEPSPSPSPSKGDYLCFDSICYEKP